jgi:hypothetical protein
MSASDKKLSLSMPKFRLVGHQIICFFQMKLNDDEPAVPIRLKENAETLSVKNDRLKWAAQVLRYF